MNNDRKHNITVSKLSITPLKSGVKESTCLEVIINRLYWQTEKSPPINDTSQLQIRLCTDEDYEYIPFSKDYGPLHLGMIHRYILTIDKMIKSDEYKDNTLIHYTSAEITKKTNSAFLVGCYLVRKYYFQYLEITKLTAQPEDVWNKFKQFEPFRPYRDPSNSDIYEQSLLECWQGLKKAIQYGWYSPDTFNAKSYRNFSKVEMGNINEIVPHRFIAMSGPYFARVDLKGKRRNIVEDYFEPFKQFGVTTVVRLNTKDYDEQKFTSRGLRHLDYYFPDGTAPRKELVQRFLNQIEQIDGCIAVHCHAGLGRTATLIGAYVIKHFKFTASEFIGWVRICRPGSMHGPQQLLLLEIEADLLQERNISGRTLFSLRKVSFPLSSYAQLSPSPPQSQHIQIRQNSINRHKYTYSTYSLKRQQSPLQKIYPDNDQTCTQIQTSFPQPQSQLFKVPPKTSQDKKSTNEFERENINDSQYFLEKQMNRMNSQSATRNNTLLSYGNETTWKLLPLLRQRQSNIRELKSQDNLRKTSTPFRINSLFRVGLLKEENL